MRGIFQWWKEKKQHKRDEAACVAEQVRKAEEMEVKMKEMHDIINADRVAREQRRRDGNAFAQRNSLRTDPDEYMAMLENYGRWPGKFRGESTGITPIPLQDLEAYDREMGKRAPDPEAMVFVLESTEERPVSNERIAHLTGMYHRTVKILDARRNITEA